MLIFSNRAKKDFCQIRPFLYREHFLNAFQANKTPCYTLVPRVVRQDIGVFATMTGEVDAAKRQGRLP